MLDGNLRTGKQFFAGKCKTFLVTIKLLEDMSPSMLAKVFNI